jgi:squalene-hopene/tetraprenyl-beta-curcumene cyclase
MNDREKYASYIRQGVLWLKKTMRTDGSWGDTVESPPNMTATLLAYASLCAVDNAPEETKTCLTAKFGGITDSHIINGVLACYGRDLTFSAPILVMCALAGIIKSWDSIPRLPFEISVLPQKLFRFFRLPVVSYAIPALIAVGILRHKKGKKTLLSPLRETFIGKSLETLVRLQPVHGGFLEAAPLTAFVAMCMSGAGYRDHTATRKGVDFLTDTVREDGAWPIDTDLACWVTALSVRALEGDLDSGEKLSLAGIIKGSAFAFRHPFTGAMEGGWGWTDLAGSAPDADDTAGALVALHILSDGRYCREARKGVEWLLSLQNSDGGMPTFCRGWGKLPFDRSSPDISAHAMLAFELWHGSLPADLKNRCARSAGRLLKWMDRAQASDGSWTPLWFGDQNAADGRSPVYGTAMAVEYLSAMKHPQAGEMREKGLKYILSVQNGDGGWGGARDVPSKVTLTARALAAIASCRHTATDAAERAFDYLYRKYAAGELLQPEPVGLYFARLWYSEELYNITFVLNALKKLRTDK